MGRSFKKQLKNLPWKGALTKTIGAAAGQYLQGYIKNYAYNKGRNMAIGYTNVANNSGARFNDMGDRGGVVTKTYRKRKRRRIPKSKRRKIRKFKRAVRRVLKTRVLSSTLQEFWPNQMTIAANTSDWFGSTLAGNVQLIIGNSAQWGINVGQDQDQNENVYISQELGAYQPRIDGTDRILFNPDLRQSAEFWISRKYLKLTIRNTNTEKDLIFDLYECVANQDIDDAGYATPVIAWQNCQEMVASVATNSVATGIGQTWIKGTEPTDCPFFGRYWKILKKEVVRIPANANVVNPYQTFTMYSPKYLYRGRKFEGKYAVKGLTKYFMIIVDPEQSATTSRYAGTDPVCAVIAHRNTHYKQHNREGQLTSAITTPNWIRNNLTVPTV